MRRLWTLETPWHLDHWAGCKQICKIERTRFRQGNESKETAYAITSLSEDKMSNQGILKLWRNHWCIENQLHHVRDVQFNEDRSTTRKGNAPQFLSCLRNTAISLLAKPGRKIKEYREELARFPRRAFKLITEN